MTAPLRVAAVEYVNAQPLWDHLLDRPGIQLTLAPPSACADGLARGEFDVSLVPAAEIHRHREFRTIGTGGVASTDRAQSVLLLSPCRLSKVDAVLRDPNSRSSNALAKVLMRQRFGLDAPFVSAQESAGFQRRARILIGDAALVPPPAGLVLDLGRVWYEWTGLPFVFARWATTHPDPPREWSRLLDAALRAGLSRRAEIAKRASHELGLPRRLLDEYLTDVLSYEMGARHRFSQELFGRLLLAPDGNAGVARTTPREPVHV